MSGATRVNDLGIYVHVPFCERVCPYCDFSVEAVGALDTAVAAEHVDLLLRDFEQECAARGDGLVGRPLATIYLGGGTPGLLPAAEVERLLSGLIVPFEVGPEEVTLELNPGQVETARARDWVAAGVTRASIGVQSLQDPILKRLGRAQSAAEARAGLESCLSAGFSSLSVDLIYGVPEQTPEQFFSDVDAVLNYAVPHVSAYALTLEPGTPFFVAHERGQWSLPSEETLERMADGLAERFEAAGRARYEISSFALPDHRSRHNQRYWLRRDVLGLGPSAASLLGGERFQREYSRVLWAEGMRSGQRMLAHRERLSGREQRRETLGLGFRRLEGVSHRDYRARFGTCLEDDFAEELDWLRQRELIIDAGDFVRLSARGLRFADDVFMQFVGD